MHLSSITFARHADGRIVHVDEVANGLACHCTCPGCGEHLVAKHGSAMAHHFAHESGADCVTARESALHIAAKAILERERRILVPELVASASAIDSAGKTHHVTRRLPSALITLDSVALEVPMGNTKPDIVAQVGPKSLIIEVAVTSFSDQVKIDRLAWNGIAAVEIDLSEIDRLASWEDISAAVIDRVRNKVWLFNPKAEALRLSAEHDANVLAEAAPRHAVTQQKHLDQSLAYQRNQIDGFEDELNRFRAFISPENQADLRASLDPDGEHDDFWQTAVAELGVEWDDPPDYLNVSVPGELIFFVDRRVWQAGIFITFIRRNSNKSFRGDVVYKWTSRCFERRATFPVIARHKRLLPKDALGMFNLTTNPITFYLRALQKMGFIVEDRERWRILKRS